MRSRILITATAMLVLGAGFALGVGPAAARELAAQTSTDRGVTVKVTPLGLAPDAAAWEFEVVFDTHTQALRDDPAASSVLVDPAGKRYAPLGWRGDPPGGHHRKGVLRFAPIRPRPGAIELHIGRAGETAPRAFRWELN